MDSDASYILTEPSTGYSLLPRDRISTTSGSGPVSPTDHHQHHQQPHHHHHNERPYLRKSNSTEKYDYRDVNLNVNSSVPDKIQKRIRLPEDYWKIHEEDVKVWRIGSTPSPASHSMANGKKSREIQKDSDWEYSVNKYENMTDRSAKGRLQYYTEHDDNGNRKNSLESDKKEIRFPGLKAFKSASMRLPGQKTSLHEVHQILRNKFNRLNVNLRKKRTMSVQEVFHLPAGQQGPPSPPHFYVPSPPGLPSRSNYADDLVERDDTNGPSSLPFYLTSTPPDANGKANNLISKKYLAPSPSSSSSPAKGMASNGSSDDDYYRKSVSRSPSNPDRTRYVSSPRAAVAKSISNSHSRPNDLAKEHSYEKLPSSSFESTKASRNRECKLPPPTQFMLGGRVSLREQNNMSRAAKITNVVKDKIRLRPRSHSPQKQYEPRTSLFTKTTPDEKTNKRYRDSFGGFFERFNRMITSHHLPPPHNNNNNHNNHHNNNNNNSNNAANISQNIGNQQQQRTKGANVIANDLPQKIISPNKSKEVTISSVTIASSGALAASKSGSSTAPITQFNKRTIDLNEIIKPHKLPEAITVRDRKITKQVRFVISFLFDCGWLSASIQRNVLRRNRTQSKQTEWTVFGCVCFFLLDTRTFSVRLTITSDINTK